MNNYSRIIDKLQGTHPGPPALLPPLTEAHLCAIEEQIGFKLPSDYRDFLRDYAYVEFGDGVMFPLVNADYNTHGGLYNLFGSTEEESLADHYLAMISGYGEASLGAGEEIEVQVGIHFLRDVPYPYTTINWPPELMPIGYDMAANPTCLALFGLRPGAVFYVIANPVVGDQNIYLVADSFGEFMNLLGEHN